MADLPVKIYPGISRAGTGHLFLKEVGCLLRDLRFGFATCTGKQVTCSREDLITCSVLYITGLSIIPI